MKKAFFSVVILAPLTMGFLLFQGSSGGSAQGAVLKYTAVISGRTYEPESIDIPFGSTVELTVENRDDEQHGLSISNFGVQDFVGPLQTKTVRFVADQVGETATFCSATHPEKLTINVI